MPGTIPPTPGAGSNGSGSTPGSGGSGGTGGSGSTNGTYTNPALSCKNPPATYMGLPTAPCGPEFDTTLDTKIGFWDWDSPAFMDGFIPGDDVHNSNKRSLRLSERDADQKAREALEIIKGVSTTQGFAAGAKNEAHHLLGQIESKMKKLGTAIVDGAKWVADVPSKLFNLIRGRKPPAPIVDNGPPIIHKPDVDKTYTVDVHPYRLPDSPFDQNKATFLFGSQGGNFVDNYYGIERAEKPGATEEEKKKNYKVEVYCVECGVKGKTRLNGALNLQACEWHSAFGCA